MKQPPFTFSVYPICKVCQGGALLVFSWRIFFDVQSPHFYILFVLWMFVQISTKDTTDNEITDGNSA